MLRRKQWASFAVAGPFPAPLVIKPRLATVPLLALTTAMVSCPIATMPFVIIFATAQMTLAMMLIITPPFLAHSLLHPCGLILRRAHTHQPRNIHANFQQPIVPKASILEADCCVSLMHFYCRLIAGGKALLLLSSPVVAVLSLPCPPPPPLPPSLADHDLGQQCEAPAAINLAHANLTAFVVYNRASIAPRPLSQHEEFLDFIIFGLQWHTCWVRIRSMASTSKTFCSHGSGDRESCGRICLTCNEETCSILSMIIDFVPYSFLFKEMLKC
jgi:hypothetical protein